MSAPDDSSDPLASKQDLLGQAALLGCSGLLVFQAHYVLGYQETAREHGILFGRGVTRGDFGLALVVLSDVVFTLMFLVALVFLVSTTQVRG